MVESTEEKKQTLCLPPYRELKMSVSFPKSVGRYWSSKAKQQGIHCCIDEASFSIDYQLKLVPVESNLIQRPKADWTIRSCNGEVKGITAHVERKVVEMPEVCVCVCVYMYVLQ